MVEEEEMQDSGAASPTSHVSADVPSAEPTPVSQVRFLKLSLGDCIILLLTNRLTLLKKVI